MNEQIKTEDCLVYLMACALHEDTPNEENLAGVDLERLLRLAKSQSVAAMSCMTLEGTQAFAGAPEQIRKRWLEAKNKAIRKNMLLDAQRKILLEEMEAQQIWYMPLKGSVLKDWYPAYGMREMADNDILFDPSKQAQVKQIFLKHGYRIEAYGMSNHDVYQKPPIYDFEMHKSLFSQQNQMQAYYENVKDRLLHEPGKSYSFCFAPEDFYVYMLAHAHKHYYGGGTGLRTLADIYVANHHSEANWEWSYVEQELCTLGILEYERKSKALADKIFQKPEILGNLNLTPEEEQMLSFYISSNTYGTVENSVANQLNALQEETEYGSLRNKLIYCRKRLFPGRQEICTAHPVVYRYPVLLPGFWVVRIVKRGFASRKMIYREIKTLFRK